MRLCLFCVLFASLSLAGCSPTSAKKPNEAAMPVAAVPTGTTLGDLIIGDPVVHQNLTLFPILSKSPKNQDRFITLDEGLAAGTVKIVEVGAETDDDPQVNDDTASAEAEPIADELQNPPSAGDDPFGDESGLPNEQQSANADPFGGEQTAGGDPFGGEVNTLMVLNTSDKPLYLMPGEIIYGGKQNRTIGEELVIQPSDKPTPIDAYCVEQGRWSGRSIEATSGHLATIEEFPGNLSLVVNQTVDHIDLAKRSQKGEFVASVGQLSNAARLAVNAKEGQSRVWEEVGVANATIGNDDEAGDFAAAYLDERVVTDLKPYVEKLEHVGQTDQIVGIAASINGKMVSVDIFESTSLFRKFWPKLLKSHSLDAAAAAPDTGDAKVVEAITVKDCVAFLKSMQEPEGTKEEKSGGQHIVRRESENGICFSYHDAAAVSEGEPQAAFAAGSIGVGLGGGLGGAVHSGGFAK